MITPARVKTLAGLSGVVLIENDRPLPLRVDAFDDVGDAERCLEWHGECFPTDYWGLVSIVRTWRRERYWPECDGDDCDIRVESGELCGCCERDALEAASSVECGAADHERA